ncbi:MAG: HAMP domain-containing protein, partial [Hyphomonadaceae bacterium]
MILRGGNLHPRSRRPMGLAWRATLYVSLLILSMALVCGATVVSAFRTDTAQHARRAGLDIANLGAGIIAQRIQADDLAGLQRAASRTEARSHVARVSIHDAEGRILAQAGVAGTPMSLRALHSAIEARAAGSLARNDIVWTVSPATTEGPNPQIVGWISVGVSRGVLERENFPALAPFFFFFIAFFVIAAPLTVMIVRKHAAPLGELTAFAERISNQGFGEQISIKTGDEFEKLANAFNEMIARLEASMKRIQRLAYVDPATQLPNAERFSRELEAHAARNGGGAAMNGAMGAVIVLHLDRLGKLLETLEQEAAVDLMTRVAERIKVGVRNVDRLERVQAAAERPTLAARLGANEFALLTPSLASEEEAARFAQMAAQSINQPFD